MQKCHTAQLETLEGQESILVGRKGDLAAILCPFGA